MALASLLNLVVKPAGFPGDRVEPVELLLAYVVQELPAVFAGNLVVVLVIVRLPHVVNEQNPGHDCESEHHALDDAQGHYPLMFALGLRFRFGSFYRSLACHRAGRVNNGSCHLAPDIRYVEFILYFLTRLSKRIRKYV